MNYCSTGSVSDVRNFQSKLVGLLNTTTSVLSHYNHHHHYNTLITFFRIIFIRMVNDSYSFANHSALQNGKFSHFFLWEWVTPPHPPFAGKIPKNPQSSFWGSIQTSKRSPILFWVSFLGDEDKFLQHKILQKRVFLSPVLTVKVFKVFTITQFMGHY